MAYNSHHETLVPGAMNGKRWEYGNVTLVSGTASLNTALTTIISAGYMQVGLTDATGTACLRINMAVGTITRFTVFGTVNIASSDLTGTGLYYIWLLGE